MRHLKKYLAGLFLIAIIAGVTSHVSLNRASADEASVDKTGDVSSTEEDSNRGRFQSAEEKLAEMEKVTEDEVSILYLDRKYMELAIMDKDSGETWFSNPYDFELDLKASSDIKTMLQSIVRLTYYDSASTERTMNSYTDCIAKNQFTIETINKGVAVHMQIGRIEEGILLPEAAEATNFDEKVMAKLSDKDKRKISAYYTKISLSDAKITDSVKEGYLKNYPGLNEHDFYILRGVVDREKKLLEKIIRKTDYSMEDYEADIVASGYTSDETIAALFNITIEFTLDKGDLIVHIPNELVSYNTEEFVLAKLILLEYFGAGKSENDGYLFVPDGSGALIDYNTDVKKNNLYTKNTVYGKDYSFEASYAYNSLSEQIHFPVFGNKENNRAMLAIIENGDAMASIVSESGNIISSYETTYPEFIYHPSSTVNYTDTIKIKGFYTYYANKPYAGDYTVRYRFLSNDNANYVGMASSYQKYLSEKGVIKKLDISNSSPKTYIEVLGAIEKKSTFLGFPYTKSIPLTSFSQAQTILSELKDTGVNEIALRYKGWANSGLFYSVSNQVKVMKSIGGVKGLKALEHFAISNQIELYPDVDFNTVRKDTAFDGYSFSKQAVQSISKEKMWIVNPEEITSLSFLQFAFNSVSPYYFKTYMDSYFKDYDKLMLKGVSIGNLGTMLYSEYRKSKAIDREQVKNLIVENMNSNIKNKELMIDGGNAYMLPYTTDIVNLPMSHSSHTLEDESIPFMQLVLHGYIDYAGTAVNLSTNIQEMFLKSIEYGANPFYTLAYENTSELKTTIYSYYYSIDYANLKEQIAHYSNKFAEAYDGVQHLTMMEHAKIEDGVYKTVYENGTIFIVNYNNYDVTVDGSKVLANDFLKLGH